MTLAAVPATPTRADAVRFLQMTTFGGRPADVDRVRSIGIDAWLDEQIAMAPSERFVDRFVRLRTSGASSAFERAIWETYLTSPDQLRQRVAYALSQILVVSRHEISDHEAADVVERLENHCFGTFRTLLETITRSQGMGRYLTYEGNRREDPRRGRYPDENYAREVMQLFTIGLWQLGRDGTRVGGATPVPTYDQDDILGLARVFTGFRRPEVNRDVASSIRQSMASTGEFADRWHETGAKSFLGVTIPAAESRTLDQSLAIALDTLANHPNVAPFISRQLIQRLVRSNPSPAYVRRVADRFVATGGNLGEVVRSIVTDDEAWPAAPGSGHFGKLREPVLRFTTICRAFGIALDSRLSSWPFTSLSDPASELGQQPFESPSVFNFYRPGYVPPQTAIGDAGLVAPEFQIANESSAIGWVNFVADVLREPPRAGKDPNRYDAVTHEFSGLTELVDTQFPSVADVQTLVDEVAARLCPRGISTELRNLVTGQVRSLTHRHYDPARTEDYRVRVRDGVHRDRVVLAIMMIAASADFLHER